MRWRRNPDDPPDWLDRQIENEAKYLRPSYVYLGILDVGGKYIFIKPGKADNIKRRLSAYITHLPGGLTGMKASGVSSSLLALELEEALNIRIYSFRGVLPMGGEWARVTRKTLDKVIAALDEIVGKHFDVETWKPKPWSPRRPRAKVLVHEIRPAA